MISIMKSWTINIIRYLSRPLMVNVETWSQELCENQSVILMKRLGTGFHRGCSDLLHLILWAHDLGSLKFTKKNISQAWQNLILDRYFLPGLSVALWELGQAGECVRWQWYPLRGAFCLFLEEWLSTSLRLEIIVFHVAGATLWQVLVISILLY